jgi:hypothetical protein
MRTKTGEEYTDVYQTSFDVGVITEDGEQEMVRARICVPKSEAVFYRGIQKMQMSGHLSELARLSAEIHCFQKGYRVIA